MIAFALALLSVTTVEHGKQMTYTVNQESSPVYVNNYDLFKLDISEQVNDGANAQDYELILNYRATSELTVYICNYDDANKCMDDPNKQNISGQESYRKLSNIRLLPKTSESSVYLLFTAHANRIVTVEFQVENVVLMELFEKKYTI